MAPFKCFVMSLIKLRWTLSFTDWHRYANDLYCIRCPLCLQILHSAAFHGQTQVFECKSQLSGLMEVKGWENASAFFHLAPAWACTSKVLGNINSRWGWGPICTVGLFLWYKYSPREPCQPITWCHWTWDWEDIHAISSQSCCDPALAQHWLEPKPPRGNVTSRKPESQGRRAACCSIWPLKQGPAASAFPHWIPPPHFAGHCFPGTWKVTITLFCEKPENWERTNFTGAFLTDYLGGTTFSSSALRSIFHSRCPENWTDKDTEIISSRASLA